LSEAKADRSIDSVVAQALGAGHEIDRSTVARYVAGGGAKNPPDAVLRALAAGLGLDVRELRTLAGQPSGELGPWTPTDESARLNLDQRRALDQLIRTMVAGAPASAVAVAARDSELPQLRRARGRRQDEAAEAPDPDGPESGA
jgi:transcriptional regulator with XRE-family HTH domain